MQVPPKKAKALSWASNTLGRRSGLARMKRASGAFQADQGPQGSCVSRGYRSAEIEKKLDERGLKSRIHRKAHRNRPLTKREQQGNKTRSKVRARVEHVFGAQTNDMGGTFVRSIGVARARARIGLKTLACTMRRAVQLDGLAAARAPT